MHVFLFAGLAYSWTDPSPDTALDFSAFRFVHQFSLGSWSLVLRRERERERERYREKEGREKDRERKEVRKKERKRGGEI